MTEKREINITIIYTYDEIDRVKYIKRTRFQEGYKIIEDLTPSKEDEGIIKFWKMDSYT